MIWIPRTVEKRQPTEVAFQVNTDLHLYLKRVALKQLLPDDPPWPVDFNVVPTFEVPDRVFISYQSVELGDWLIGSNGSPCLQVVSKVVFNRLYREVIR